MDTAHFDCADLPGLPESVLECAAKGEFDMRDGKPAIYYGERYRLKPHPDVTCQPTVEVVGIVRPEDTHPEAVVRYDHVVYSVRDEDGDIFTVEADDFDECVTGE